MDQRWQATYACIAVIVIAATLLHSRASLQKERADALAPRSGHSAFGSYASRGGPYVSSR